MNGCPCPHHPTGCYGHPHSCGCTRQTMTDARETIIAAAIQYEGVTISLPQPARHGQVMHSAESFMTDYQIAAACQGFLTSTGRFVNRVQARQIAYVAGQEPKTTGNERDLFSEDLW